MRFLISEKSRKYLFNFLKQKENCKSLKELSISKNIPLRTLQNWLYEMDRYIPEEFVPLEIRNNLEVIDKQENNWGSVRGGKKTYQIILSKYGEQELKKRQSNGGKKAIKINRIKQKQLVIDIHNPNFLEFYGVLLGDGWLSKLNYKNKNIWLIGVSGDKRWDMEFYLYLQENIFELFGRRAYLKIKKQNNSIEINFGHKTLIETLNTELEFPIGKKNNLSINNKIYNLGYEKVKHVIRGIFDTDGSFYLDKTPTGNPYPIISIEMKAGKLINQIYKILLSQGFRVSYRLGRNKREGKDRITLKGKKQLDKWMQEIGSSNQRHLKKINGLVTQPG